MPYQTNAILQKIIAQKLVFLAKQKVNFVGKKILDVGCGTGFLAQHLVQGGALPSNILQIDFNEKSLNFARNYGKIVKADFNKPLPVYENFDVIISSMALQWAGNFKSAFLNLKEKLNNGSSIFVAIPLCGSLNEVYKILGKEFLQFPQNIPMKLIEEKKYAENAFICLKNIHAVQMKVGGGVLLKKQLLLLKNTQTVWKIGFFYFQNAG